jgi:hypothetical protein
MTLQLNLRGFRALIAACVVLALTPAAAAAKSHTSNGLGTERVGLSPTTQLAAMNAGLEAAPAFFSGRTTGCTVAMALLTAQSGPVIAGNFRDANGACYVWLNLRRSSLLTGSELCKIALHEYGHLTGLQHSSDPTDVMFSPFRSDPIPGACQAQPTGTAAKKQRKHR